jgi:hypothetical protein
MTNHEIISLARSTIQSGDDPVGVLNKNKLRGVCAGAFMIAFNLLRGYEAVVGIPANPDRDERLARYKEVAGMLGAVHSTIRVDHHNGPGYLDAFNPITPHRGLA